jgi:hypothetical protein
MYDISVLYSKNVVVARRLGARAVRGERQGWSQLAANPAQVPSPDLEALFAQKGCWLNTHKGLGAACASVTDTRCASASIASLCQRHIRLHHSQVYKPLAAVCKR